MKVSLTVDASFCYLLLTIETLWTVNPGTRRTNLLGNIFLLMIEILGLLARFLLTQPLGDRVAGPCFNYYPFQSIATALGDLQKEIQGAIDAYHGDSQAQEQLQTVQTTIGELANVATDS